MTSSARATGAAWTYERPSRRERWGDLRRSTATWTGCPPSMTYSAWPSRGPSTSGSRVPTAARTTSKRYSRRQITNDLTFVRALPLSAAADPSSEILVAYEMNGEALRPDHGAPFRLIVPHWYAVASVKWLKRIDVPDRALHRRVPDWPLHLPVARSSPRARQVDACARPHHRPLTRRDPARRHLHSPRESVVGNGAGDAGRRKPHRAKETGCQLSSTPRRVPTSGRTGLSRGTPATSDDTPCAPAPPTPPETSSRTSHHGTGWDTGTTPSKSSSSICTEREHVHSRSLGSSLPHRARSPCAVPRAAYPYRLHSTERLPWRRFAGTGRWSKPDPYEISRICLSVWR